MKLNKKTTFISVLSASLLVCSTVNADQMEPIFKDVLGYKNIAFGAAMGGASHYNWVLSIQEELGQRGHNVSFLTSTEDLRFGKPYPHVNTVDIGPAVKYDKVETIRTMTREMNMAVIMPKLFVMVSQNYERDYLSLVDYFRSHSVDLALCDHFMSSCVDAANTCDIPFIITAAVSMTKDSDAPYINQKMFAMDDPTTENQSFIARFKNKLIAPGVFLYNFLPAAKQIQAKREAVGIMAPMQSPDKSWENSMKLVNNIFGYSAARPIGPLAEYIGPIIPKHYVPLTEELDVFLNAHERVAFVAFGQNAAPEEESINLILTSLLESVENGSLDGLLWATVHVGDFFPDAITTSSGITYNIQEMVNGTNPHARLIKWAPQTAVLLHKSTAVFVSHGGLGSWYESMYSGTPMIMFPFFADQPSNSVTIERSKLGGILRREYSVKEVVDLIKKIVTDETGEIKDSVKRMQALTQIHSEHGVVRGADLVEEVAYTHKDRRLLHRESADRRMSYVKSHDLDIYAAFFSLLAAVLSAVIFAVYKVFMIVYNKQNQQPKVKNFKIT